MTKKKIEELSSEEQKEFARLLWSWLKEYKDEVVNKVLERAEEIYNDEATMTLLKELDKRQAEEEEQHEDDLYWTLTLDDKKFWRFEVLTHSKSYRDVLEDKYIRD